ncbi:hypothetical protein Tco_0974629 [Tanacetum coccineum]|uniref:Uncharacterized protein n=1 Tax=Tanacetum coccineum TaxID=301880 RepID=A0ABQ5EC78_9ASTR
MVPTEITHQAPFLKFKNDVCSPTVQSSFFHQMTSEHNRSNRNSDTAMNSSQAVIKSPTQYHCDICHEHSRVKLFSISQCRMEILPVPTSNNTVLFNLALLQNAMEVAFFPKTPFGFRSSKAYHGQEGGFDTNGCSFQGWALVFRFWKDLWVGAGLLFTRYNRLYPSDQDKDFLFNEPYKQGNGLGIGPRTNLGVEILPIM